MEATSVTSLLATASISAQVDVATGALDEQVDTVLATILREAVTNMLTHSAVRHCVIKADVAGDTVRLQVRNDGVTGPGGSRGRPGGLDNLRARLEAIGGTLTVEARGGAHDGAGLRWRRRQAGRGPGQGGV
jgi:signal transduction histidine kinase